THLCLAVRWVRLGLADAGRTLFTTIFTCSSLVKLFKSTTSPSIDMQMTHFYLSPTPNDQRNLNSLLDCLENKCWMAQNVLQLNENKSEVILFGFPDSIKLT